MALSFTDLADARKEVRLAISNWVQTNFLFPPKRAFQGLTVDLIFQA